MDKSDKQKTRGQLFNIAREKDCLVNDKMGLQAINFKTREDIGPGDVK